MGKTAAEKIISSHAHEDVKGGDYVVADVDLAMIHDTTGPIAIRAFEEYGKEKVWDPSKMVIVLDHATPSPNERISG
ncbi:MAG: 3-isopropylmalate dehydratase large subunit, partial [Synergistaceae bacterium]|nr:3-isopropylmalate dehydratase large subunit [Synergistaceae bacterium]